MMLLNRLFQTRTHHVGINLRGSDVGVSQHGLDAAEISSALQEVRSKGVAEYVRANLLKHAGCSCSGSKQLPESLAAHGLTAPGYK